jgi:hypothetical protein
MVILTIAGLGRNALPIHLAILSAPFPEPASTAFTVESKNGHLLKRGVGAVDGYCQVADFLKQQFCFLSPARHTVVPRLECRREITPQ